MAENNENSEMQVDIWKVESTSHCEIKLTYHFTTFLREGDLLEQHEHNILKSDVHYHKSIGEFVKMQSQLKDSQSEIHGTNNGKYLHSKISTAFLIELLQKVTHCLKYIHEKQASFGQIDSSCVYLSEDQKQIAIANPAFCNNINSMKCFARLALHILSNGLVSDHETSPNVKSFSELRAKCQQKKIVNASSLLRILIDEQRKANSVNTEAKQENNILERIKSLTDFLCCKEPILAFDLVIKMYNGEYGFDEMLSHPFFWSESKKCQFILNVFGYFKMKDGFKDGYKKKYDDDLRGKYKMSGEFVFSENGWIESLKISEDDLGKMNETEKIVTATTICSIAIVRKHEKHSLYDLMRFFRNRYSHFFEDGEAVRLAFENNATGFWNFFASRYPCFLYYIHMKMWPNVKKHVEFRSFGECAPESSYLCTKFSADS